jgi:5-methylcytosine-specific restriction enzyme A
MTGVKGHHIKRSWSGGKKLDKDQGGYQWLYYTKRWKLHRLNQLRRYPLCATCLADNIVKAATIAHHIHDHRGDYRLFFTSPLQSLCKSCHDNKRGSHIIGYQRGCDIDGRPYETKPIYVDKNKSAGGQKEFDIGDMQNRRILFARVNFQTCAVT